MKACTSIILPTTIIMAKTARTDNNSHLILMFRTASCAKYSSNSSRMATLAALCTATCQPSCLVALPSHNSKAVAVSAVAVACLLLRHRSPALTSMSSSQVIGYLSKWWPIESCGQPLTRIIISTKFMRITRRPSWTRLTMSIVPTQIKMIWREVPRINRIQICCNTEVGNT